MNEINRIGRSPYSGIIVGVTDNWLDNLGSNFTAGVLLFKKSAIHLKMI